jgi:hypothetical protein
MNMENRSVILYYQGVETAVQTQDLFLISLSGLINDTVTSAYNNMIQLYEQWNDKEGSCCG